MVVTRTITSFSSWKRSTSLANAQCVRHAHFGTTTSTSRARIQVFCASTPNLRPLSVRAPRLRAARAADTSGARRAGVKLKVVYRPNRGDERSSKFEN